MPRAHRYFLPGYVWHITHRCHQQAFLLKFARDRRCWIQWLYEARKRYGLGVLNYSVTSNHVHLLVQDTGDQTIPRSLQLIAGRTAQSYNQRKHCKGAFWEDRYHATAVATDEHLLQCLVYIDLNMVRAGVVRHPADWPHGGYRELQRPPQRYRIIDTRRLLALIGTEDWPAFQQRHREWVNDAIARDRLSREPVWSETLAVGHADFVQEVQDKLGVKALHREIDTEGAQAVLREGHETYRVNLDRENTILRQENRLEWNDYGV